MITSFGKVTVQSAELGVLITDFTFEGSSFAAAQIDAAEWAIARLQDEIAKLRNSISAAHFSSSKEQP